MENSKAHIENISDADYFARKEISKHNLDEFERNPWKFLRLREEGIAAESTETAELLFGRAVHAAILTPERYGDEFAVLPPEIKVRRGKAWDEFAAANAEKSIISADVAETVENLVAEFAATAKGTDIADALKACDRREQAIFWEDAETGVQMKAKLDFATADFRLVGDLKTCADASPEAFVAACAKYGYHRQAAVYMDAVYALTGEMPEEFVFICVEKSYPFTPALYAFASDSEFVKAGRAGYLRALKSYAELAELSQKARTNIFTARDLKLPAWCDDLKLI